MIELKHYVAYWKAFDASSYFSGAHEAIFRRYERFISRKEAEKKVSEELRKFKDCEISEVEWFKKNYLSNISEHFYVEECDKIY